MATELTTNELALYWLAYVFLLALSSLFSGLTLGIMSLDVVQLKILINSPPKAIGSKVSKYAKAILPVRLEGSWTLCSLVLGNVLVNSAIAVFSGTLVGEGITAVLVSTAFIVVFSEILPQTICSRHGLIIGYYTLPIFKFLRLLMSPIAFPISRLLDWILGVEIGTHFDRDQFKALISHHEQELNLFNASEANMMRGAFDFASKKTENCMTPILDVFSISINEVLNYDLLSKIVQAGYSRIPVVSECKINNSYMEEHIVGIVMVKDLVLIDPDACVPIRQLLQLFEYNIIAVDNDTTLLNLLAQMKMARSHFAIVRKISSVNDADPFWSHIGIITMEDLIEELIQNDIDEDKNTITIEIDNNTNLKKQDISVKPFLKEIDTKKIEEGRIERRKKREQRRKNNKFINNDHQNHIIKAYDHTANAAVMTTTTANDKIQHVNSSSNSIIVEKNKYKNGSPLISRKTDIGLIDGDSSSSEESQSGSFDNTTQEICNSESKNISIILSEDSMSGKKVEPYPSNYTLNNIPNNQTHQIYLKNRKNYNTQTAAVVTGRLQLLDKRRLNSELSSGERKALELFLSATQKVFSKQLLPPFCLQEIIQQGSARRISSGSILYQSGTSCDFATVVLHGSFRILIEDGETEARIGPWQALSCSTALFLPPSVQLILKKEHENQFPFNLIKEEDKIKTHEDYLLKHNIQYAVDAYLNNKDLSVEELQSIPYSSNTNFVDIDYPHKLVSPNEITIVPFTKNNEKKSIIISQMNQAIRELEQEKEAKTNKKLSPLTIECIKDNSRIFIIHRKKYLETILNYIENIRTKLDNVIINK